MRQHAHFLLCGSWLPFRCSSKLPCICTPLPVIWPSCGHRSCHSFCPDVSVESDMGKRILLQLLALHTDQTLWFWSPERQCQYLGCTDSQTKVTMDELPVNHADSFSSFDRESKGRDSWYLINGTSSAIFFEISMTFLLLKVPLLFYQCLILVHS